MLFFLLLVRHLLLVAMYLLLVACGQIRNAFFLLLVRHLLLVAMHLLLVACGRIRNPHRFFKHLLISPPVCRRADGDIGGAGGLILRIPYLPSLVKLIVMQRWDSVSIPYGPML